MLSDLITCLHSLFTNNQSLAFAVKEDSGVLSANHPSYWLILGQALVVPVCMNELLPNFYNNLMLDLRMGVTPSIKKFLSSLLLNYDLNTRCLAKSSSSRDSS